MLERDLGTYWTYGVGCFGELVDVDVDAGVNGRSGVDAGDGSKVCGSSVY